MGKDLVELFYVSIARFLIFLWCIVTDLSLSSKSWKDDDLCIVFNTLSCILNISSLRVRLWENQTKEQYPN